MGKKDKKVLPSNRGDTGKVPCDSPGKKVVRIPLYVLIDKDSQKKLLQLQAKLERSQSWIVNDLIKYAIYR